jgi:hypothetical protein
MSLLTNVLLKIFKSHLLNNITCSRYKFKCLYRLTKRSIKWLMHEEILEPNRTRKEQNTYTELLKKIFFPLRALKLNFYNFNKNANICYIIQFF